MDNFSVKKVERYEFCVKYLILLSLCFFVINCSSNSPKTIQDIAPNEIFENAININKANAEELQKLPHIGVKTAEKIIAHREKFGDFRRAEHLLLVAGISDKRFRNMRSMKKVK